MSNWALAGEAISSYVKNNYQLEPYAALALDTLPAVGQYIDSENYDEDNFKRQMQFLHDQQAYNSFEAEKQRQFNQASIREAREYNSPVNVMSRLQAAGLNPNLVAGNIDGGMSLAATGGSSAAHSPNLSAPMHDPQLRLMNAQAGLLEAQTRKADADTGVVSTFREYQHELLQGEIKLQNVTFNMNDATRQYTLEQQKTLWHVQSQIDQNIENAKQEFRLISANANMAEIDASWRKRMNSYNWQKIGEEINLIAKQAQESQGRFELSQEQKKYVKDYAEAAVTAALASKKQADSYGENVSNQKDYWEELGRITGIDADVMEACKQFTTDMTETMSKTMKVQLENLDDFGKALLVAQILNQTLSGIGALGFLRKGSKSTTIGTVNNTTNNVVPF
ncbi:DNA pilot protein [Microvirus mar52]|uniref:DNA pilot protein n=1 Tax=Microvirus mar52 TaxID=2851188 RepID=A0A8F5MLQ3_9VIRU|nr:DNA pilot protein [Microvirus mar52]